jgi:hypothetical protein
VKVCGGRARDRYDWRLRFLVAEIRQDVADVVEGVELTETDIGPKPTSASSSNRSATSSNGSPPLSSAAQATAESPSALLGAPLFSAHIRASCLSSSSSQPRVAASWNIAWNSVESICGTFRATH